MLSVKPSLVPLILFSASAAHLLPDGLRGHVKAERLMALMTGSWEEATDAEALAYLYSASLDRPLGHDITQVYGYLFSRHIRREGQDMPDELVVETLTRDQEHFLGRLKRWLRRQQRKAWSERRRETRRAKQAVPDSLAEVHSALAKEPTTFVPSQPSQLVLTFDSSGREGFALPQ